MEKVKLYHSDIIRYARADVESARVDANREFFDNFDEIVEDDAVWAYKFQRATYTDRDRNHSLRDSPTSDSV
jgi:hypothetical protein